MGWLGRRCSTGTSRRPVSVACLAGCPPGDHPRVHHNLPTSLHSPPGRAGSSTNTHSSWQHPSSSSSSSSLPAGSRWMAAGGAASALLVERPCSPPSSSSLLGQQQHQQQQQPSSQASHMGLTGPAGSPQQQQQQQQGVQQHEPCSPAQQAAPPAQPGPAASPSAAAASASGPAYQTRLLLVDLPAFTAHLAAAAAAAGDEAGPDYQHYRLPPAEPEGPAAAHQSSSSSSSNAAAYARALEVLSEAAALLRGGAVVALPTETVYGLAADATSSAAVGCVFAAKGRPPDNPLIVHVSDMAMLARLYPGQSLEEEVLPRVYAPLVAALWPGPLTLLLPASPLVAPEVTAGHATMAVRMPSHPLARALIHLAGVPLAAPSANTSGRPSPTDAAHVLSDLGGRIPLVVDGGECEVGLESTVLDGLRDPPAVLRPGGVTAEALAAFPGLEQLGVYAVHFRDAALESAPTTPGMKYRHYSPATPLWLVDPTGQQPAGNVYCSSSSSSSSELSGTGTDSEPSAAAAAAAVQEPPDWSGIASAVAGRALALAQELQGQGYARVALLRTSMAPGVCQGWVTDPAAGGQQGAGQGPSAEAPAGVFTYCLGSAQQPQQVARQLFKALREVDAAGMGAVVVEGLVGSREGLAIMNRLRKAASHVVEA